MSSSSGATVHAHLRIRSFRYQKSACPLIQGVDVDFGAGITSLLGVSGVGKTTVLRLLMGMARGHGEWDVCYTDTNATHTPAAVRRSGWLGIVTDEDALLPWINVRLNLLLSGMLTGRPIQHRSTMELRHVLRAVGLRPRVLRQRPFQLSHGMRRRASVARALLAAPRVLFLDEVFNGLDPSTADLVADAVGSYVRIYNAVCLLVTHDVDRACRVSERLLFLRTTGRIDDLPRPLDRDQILAMYGEELGRRCKA